MTDEPIKFLLVDDVEDNLLAAEALLERDGVVVLKATSGREALELLLTNDVTLALLDVQMPGMDGFELAERMRATERTRHVPIIFITGDGDPVRGFQGYEYGAVDVLYKPVDPRILRSKADAFVLLQRQRREYAEALRMNERFIGILGHDLKGPLSAVLTGARVLEGELLDEKHRRMLEVMTSASRRMSDMIDQLLDLSRSRLIDGIGLGRSRQPADVTALARRAVEELVALHPSRDIVLRTPGELPANVDAERLMQLFSNLIANAVEHGDPGTRVTVDISTNPDGVAFSVHNAGVIAPELLPALFEPFGRRQKSGTRRRGLGLGLYIARQIALAHGGKLDVVSRPESGTAFELRIPRRLPSDPPSRAAARPTVLVVDDDLETREALQEEFERHGYATLTAADGGQALARLRDGAPRPSVVVLDMVLPVLDGHRVFEAMQADPELSGIPVIASTATAERAPRGVVVVPKPVKLDSLLKTVAVLCRQA